MENQALSSRFSNPAAYIKLFFRRKWLLIVPAYLGLVAGIIACFVVPRTWMSTTIILVEEEKIINPLIQNLAVSTTAVQRMHSIRETLLGWNSLVELVRKLNLAKNINSQLEFENLITKLRRNINVQLSAPNRQQQLPTNSIVKISYLAEDPREAQMVAQSLTDILMEKNLEAQTKETDVAIDFITEQLSIYKRKIKESEIAKLKEDLKSLLTDSTELHPLVKELRGKIAIAEKELESGEYEVKGAGKALDSATKEALRQELDKIIEKESSVTMPKVSYGNAAEPPTDPNASVYKLLLMDKVDSALARDIDVNEAIYNMLLQKLETAKITQRLEVSKEGTRYTILDPARLPLVPVKPNKPLLVLMGLFAGTASGIGLIFAREFMDQSILDIQDAKLTLDLPVLGAISRITTQEEIEKEKSRRRTAIVTGLIVTILTVAITMLIAFFKN